MSIKRLRDPKFTDERYEEAVSVISVNIRTTQTKTKTTSRYNRRKQNYYSLNFNIYLGSDPILINGILFRIFVSNKVTSQNELFIFLHIQTRP